MLAARCKSLNTDSLNKGNSNFALAGLPKQAKLLKAAEFKNVFDKAVRSSDRYFTVLARPNALSHARLGMAFTKKRVKLAVARNRLKRITRESFRLTQGKFSADYIVLAGAKCAQANNQALFKSLEKHWQDLDKKCAKL